MRSQACNSYNSDLQVLQKHLNSNILLCLTPGGGKRTNEDCVPGTLLSRNLTHSQRAHLPGTSHHGQIWPSFRLNSGQRGLVFQSKDCDQQMKNKCDLSQHSGCLLAKWTLTCKELNAPERIRHLAQMSDTGLLSTHMTLPGNRKLRVTSLDQTMNAVPLKGAVNT